MNLEIQAQLDVIKAPAQAQLDAANAIPSLVDTAEAAADAAGFARGQASIVLPDPTDPSAQYTQAQMDALAEVVRGENDVEVSGLNDKIAALQTQVDATAGKLYSEEELQAKLSQSSKDVLNGFKGTLRAKYGESQARESADELDLLKDLEPVV